MCRAARISSAVLSIFAFNFVSPSRVCRQASGKEEGVVKRSGRVRSYSNTASIVLRRRRISPKAYSFSGRPTTSERDAKSAGSPQRVDCGKSRVKHIWAADPPEPDSAPSVKGLTRQALPSRLVRYVAILPLALPDRSANRRRACAPCS